MSINPSESAAWRGMAELFRPPPGFQVHRIFGTTFGLSVDALVAMLLATEGVQAESAAADTVSKLLTATRLAGRVRIMVQDGSISGDAMRVPASLVALLDQCIVSVNVEHGTFHPKLWVIAFCPIGSGSRKGQSETFVRAVIGSRNLTLSTALEFGLVLEGVTGTQNDLSKQLSSILSECVPLKPAALSPIVAELRAVLKHMCLFATPEMSKDVRLFWQSSKRALTSAFPRTAKRIVVVSPFFNTTVIGKLLSISGNVTLVSTPAALAAAAAKDPMALNQPEKLRLLAVRDDVPNVDEESGQVVDDANDFSGLHAKLLLFEHSNGDTEAFFGSANATVRGFGLAPQRNVECVVHAKPGISITQFERDFLSGKKGLSGWIRPFEMADARMPTDEEELSDMLIDHVRQCAAIPFHLTYQRQTGMLWVKAVPHVGHTVPDGCIVECTPLAVMEERESEDLSGRWVSLEQFETAEGVAFNALLAKVSPFVAVRVRHSSGASRTRIAQGTLTWDGSNADERDKAARQALLDGIDSAEILARLVLGVATRPRRLPKLSGESSGQGTITPAAFAYVGLEQVLQAIVRMPSLLEDLRLLVEDRNDAHFNQLIKDVRAVEETYAHL